MEHTIVPPFVSSLMMLDLKIDSMIWYTKTKDIRNLIVVIYLCIEIELIYVNKYCEELHKAYFFPFQIFFIIHLAFLYSIVTQCKGGSRTQNYPTHLIWTRKRLFRLFHRVHAGLWCASGRWVGTCGTPPYENRRGRMMTCSLLFRHRKHHVVSKPSLDELWKNA